MNRYQMMDEYLKHMAGIFKENNDRVIPYDDICKLVNTFLVNMDTKDPNADFSKEGSDVFSRLQSYFSDSRNMKVYPDPENGYFLQFQNLAEQHLNNMDVIRLYIPQDALNMERSARELFDYLDASNISHISRISKKERNDNIIVQVTNWNDANRIIDFASGNRQLKSGMLPANPFDFSVDNIAISTGRGGSVNNVITYLMATYFNDRIINEELDKVDLPDFIKFTQDYYHHHFEDFRDIGEVVTDFQLEGCEVSTNENNRKIANIGNLINLFLKEMDPKFDLNGFREFYLESNNDGKLIGIANAIGLLRKETNTANGNDFVGSIDTILLNSVDEFMDRYHTDEQHALKIIGNYLEDGNIQKITRHNDVRKKIVKSDFRNKLPKLLEISGQDLETYYNNKKASRAIRALHDAIYQTYQKYEDRYEEGFEQTDGYTRATYALKSLILDNNAQGFTRDNNARQNLIKYGDAQVLINDIAYSHGHEIYFENPKDVDAACGDYVTKVVSSKLEDKQITYAA